MSRLGWEEHVGKKAGSDKRRRRIKEEEEEKMKQLAL